MSWTCSVALADRTLTPEALARMGLRLTDERTSFEEATSIELSGESVGVFFAAGRTLLATFGPELFATVSEGGPREADWAFAVLSGAADVYLFSVLRGGTVVREVQLVQGDVVVDRGPRVPGEPEPDEDGWVDDEDYFWTVVRQFGFSEAVPDPEGLQGFTARYAEI